MESPFDQYLNTNYIPTDAEIEQVSAHLAPHEAELAQLESLISSLCFKRDRLQSYVASHRALISHPRRSPHDILEQIFLGCLPGTRNASIPRLWTSLHIPIKLIRGDAARVEAVVNWLERSAPFPLEISIQCPGFEGLWDDTHCTELNSQVYQYLSQFSHRWRSIPILDIQESQFMTRFASLAAPLLECITVTLEGRDDREYHRSGDPQLLSSDILMGPKLHTAHLHTLCPNHCVAALPSVWNNLTNLTLRQHNPHGHIHGGRRGGTVWNTQQFLTPQSLYFLLEACANLVSLRTQICDEYSGPNMPVMVQAPHLELLEILDGSDVSHGALVLFLSDHLLMTQLRTFRVTPTSLAAFPRSFFYALAGHSPLISNLSIPTDIFHKIRGGRFAEAVEILPFLNTLHMLLTQQRTLCPILHHLILDECSPMPLETWIDILHKHLDVQGGLRRVEVIFRYEAPEIVPDVEPFISRGLDLSIEYVPRNPMPPTTSPWTGLENV
ncbi:hypothetical protein B0H16DRAFT_1792738 [Mycena metata]|uniref:F-box domain-containing protein n=1 Tax=Mycena metata TaxID=1033252 RepID=A0AAD7HGZ0_9AGAR|nr:hypothetical protein B0H16DRAFT_1792738 [Mycena metata]